MPRLYVGLPGSTSAVSNPAFYLKPAESLKLVKVFFCKLNFRGVMLWNATYADSNVSAGFPYYLLVKNYLLLTQKQNTLSDCVSPASTM